MTSTGPAADVYSGSLTGSSTSPYGSLLDFTETLTLQDAIPGDGRDHSIDYGSVLTVVGGTINADGSVSYDFDRSETIDNRGQIEVNGAESAGIAAGHQAGVYMETGSANSHVNASIAATQTRTTTAPTTTPARMSKAAGPMILRPMGRSTTSPILSSIRQKR